ncbi:MAG: UDP-N-acetylmuramoyl-L-alanyl-D-glutamate--2,6-diaminopimelate ligase [Prevotella sp.]|nr:UDP-N-acetylmuramoyl-L-alanyl-D-glutamate--2,6-diaminopimelate ligase [Prevotella sp.]
MLPILLVILVSLLALAAVGTLFLKYMRRVIIERDLHFAGEDKSSVPFSYRMMAKVVPVLRIAHSKVVAWWYGHPSKKLKLVGVTGTNGKTTTATVLYDLFRQMGHRCGLISTVSICIDGETLPAVITTPGAAELNRLMDRMVKAGCEYVFMECSSHGLVHNRVSGLHFTGGIFTNLTRDHLDDHRTFANYRNAKKSYFDMLPPQAFAIVNDDDCNSNIIVSDCKATVKTYSIQHQADFTGHVLGCNKEGMRLEIDGHEVDVHFIGRFNASNLLGVYATAVMLGKRPDDILTVMPLMRSVTGRLEPVDMPQGFTALVDYAHTPDALHNVLSAIHDVLGHQGKIVTVCGAGGNRDKGKRPLIAQEAVRQSDQVVLTSDNPRFEDPQEIINDMLAGLDEMQKEKVVCIVDRREAIRRACEMAGRGDVVLLAGKGHEDYQDVNGVRHHFSDKETLKEICDMIKSQ